MYMYTGGYRPALLVASLYRLQEQQFNEALQFCVARWHTILIAAPFLYGMEEQNTCSLVSFSMTGALVVRPLHEWPI